MLGRCGYDEGNYGNHEEGFHELSQKYGAVMGGVCGTHVELLPGDGDDSDAGLILKGFRRFSPTLAVGLLDSKVDVVFAQLEADFCDQP